MRRWFRNRSDKRLDQELRFHFEEQVAEHVAAGLSPEEAHRQARLEFGHLDEVKEECRDARPFAWMDGLLRDARFALRLFARSPGFTAVCLITLALGIGVNGAVFSVMNKLVLSQPPFAEPDRLISIDEQVVSREHFLSLRGAKYFPFYPQRDTFQTISTVAVLDDSTIDLREGDEAETLREGRVSANLLDVLGIATERGRWISAAEGRDLSPVAVLSHALWRRRFAEDPNIIGRTIHLADYRGERLYQVIGVLPRSVEDAFPLLGFDLYTPYDTSGLETSTNSAEETIARLAPGATRAGALDELISRQVALYPEKNHANGGWQILVRTLNEEKIWYVRSGLWVLVGTVGCVLLIACMNLAGLLLTRGAERKHEMAIRTGLGASRGTILSQTFVEIGLLSLGGGALALFTAWTCIRSIRAIRFAQMPDLSHVTLDWPVVLCCLVLSLLTALFIGVLPSWSASRANALGILRQKPTTFRSGDRRVRDILVAAQITLSVVLVVGAGLLLHSMGRLLAVDPGYDSTNVVSFSLSTNGWDDAQQLWTRINESVQSLPGVEDAATVDYGPPMQVGMMIRYQLPGDTATDFNEGPVVNARSVSENYFSLLKIRFLAGQSFSRTLDPDRAEIVVSRSFAEMLWPKADAVGNQLSVYSFGKDAVDAEVVGVVDDVRQISLRDKPEPMLYKQGAETYQELLVKTSIEPHAMIDPIKRTIWSIDPTQPFRMVNTIQEREANQTAEMRFYMYLLSAFAGLALLLAVVGLYSVASQAAVRRTQEIGLRMAVGANRWQILLMIAKQGLMVAVAGTVVGLGAAYALSKYLESWLYEITPTDPLTFVAAAGLLALAAWIATVIPARRASRLDPMKALRYE